MVLLNPDFNCSENFISFSFDRLATGTDNFVSVVLNSNSAVETIAGLLTCAFLLVILTKTQFLAQVKINSTSQLISGVFKLLQKLLNHFSGITTSA